MDLLRLICPSSPSVWDGNRLSECFSNIVLAFGGNVVTIFMIAMLGITNRNKQRTSRMNFFGKAVFYVLPILGASLSFLDVAFLLKTAYHGGLVMYHSWLFRCSRFAVWVLTILALKFPCGSFIFYNSVLCFWWAIKPLFMIPNLQETFRSLEVLACLNESCMFLVDVMFGVSLNVIRMKRVSSKSRQLEESLLSLNEDTEANSHKGLGTAESYWDLVTFKSIAKVMNRGVIKQLDFEDLLSLPSDMDPSSCHDALFSCWQDQWNCNSNEPSLFKVLWCAYGWSYLRLGLLKVVNDLLGFAGPLLLNKLIRSLQRGSGNVDGYIFAISLGLTSIVKSFLDTQYTFHLAKLKLKLRSSIMTVIYKKCLSVSLAEQAQFSNGEIQTFMSIDADRTVNLCNSLHDMWSLPLQIGVALYLLYMQVKFAFAAGVAITVLLIPVNKWISTLIAAATQNMMKQKDERIRRTGELLSHIRTLKMYGWELLFSNWLLETRSLEIKHLKTRKYLDAWCVFFWATTPTLFSLFTFGLYTLMGHQLDAATVFTCLALFNTLISPLNSFPWVINGLIDAFISTNRLSRFLCCPEHQYEQCAVGSSSLVSGSTKSQFSSDSMAVVMYDACCNWSSSNMQQLSPVIDHIALAIPKGSIVAVIGEVGSGKSSLLNAILGEMRLIHGSISSIGSVAYVPQVPWIMSGTLCENVLFGKKYDLKRYSDTIQACALDVDISLMAGGDMAYIGEKGINLSGGQRARLALARAIYHGSDILMLDDVLSAVDSQVAQWILNHAILGPLTEQNTRVLCTHNTQETISSIVPLPDR